MVYYRIRYDLIKLITFDFMSSLNNDIIINVQCKWINTIRVQVAMKLKLGFLCLKTK